MKKIIAAIAVILVVSGSFLMLGFLWGNDFQFTDKPKQITPTLDGVINHKEWKRANYYNIPFYLDVDNSIDPVEGKRNVDGWNYLSVGEDDNYYFVALDLCSDRTNNLDGEWISYFMANRMPEISSSKLAFQSLVDYGYEYLYYNVSGDVPYNNSVNSFPFTTNFNDIPFVPEYDYMEVLYGETSDNYLDFWSDYDGKSFDIASSNVSGRPIWLDGGFIDVMFGMNITEKMPQGFEAQFMSGITDLDLRFIISSDLTAQSSDHLNSAEKFYCGVYEHGGMPGNISDPMDFSSDPNVINFDNDTITQLTVDLDHTTINATNGMIYFTFHCFNELNATFDTFYNIFIDRLALRITTDSIGQLLGNSITLGNYDLAWSYGASDMCSEDHRMFEFKIAKAEFPVLADDMLYLFVAGYGTMSFFGTNYWAYPGSSEDNPMHGSPDSQSLFLALDMSET
ncbi:MAG: hypothetical protein ACTSO7_11340 [Candidatus Heimdallarchaeota archaeon]